MKIGLDLIIETACLSRNEKQIKMIENVIREKVRKIYKEKEKFSKNFLF